ncbi:MAG TPA: xanthine dehydrogenase family protein molybdopterin-binding subunit [Acetobacteraceae bacterium]|nr:xanthine dehydrogenase family protein molybdopterin-binding subunit [Acetobacteraceae bacterium]
MGAHAFGQPALRREDTRLLRGTGRFLADLVPGDAARAVMLRSPHAHAAICGVDAAAARAMPGVLAVLTGEDWAADGLGAIPAGHDFPTLPRTPNRGTYRHRPHRPALARGRVRFAGETVAMIVAETEALARDAAEGIAIDYEPLPCVTDTEAAVRLGAPAIWAEAADNVCFRWEAGDADAVAAAFSRAARVVRVSLRNNRVHVGAIETRGAIGAFADGRFTLTTGSQMPHALRDALAHNVLRVPPETVRVIVADVGGSFGIKNALYPEQALVLWAARRLGRTVAWIGERSDGFLSDYQARDNASTASLALDAAGRFLALRVETVANIGAYLSPEGWMSPTINTPALAGVYRLPAIRVSVTGAFSNTAPVEVYRGAGRPEAVHLLERLVDAAAAETAMEPGSLRRRNLLPPDALPYQTALGLLYDSGDFPAMLEAALARTGVSGFPARRAEAAARGMLRGIGLAQYCERVAGAWAEDARVELDASGHVTLLVGTMSNGQGHETAYAQLVADALGIAAEAIEIVQGDTDRIPTGRGTGGSASLSIGGAAASAAASDLVRNALPLAADALEAAVADVVFEDGAFRIAGTDRRMRLASVAARLGQHGTPARLAGTGRWQPSGPSFPNGCHAAEVEVDPETGAWRLVAYTMLHDFGRVLNPKLLEGQLQGGVAQGFGQAALADVVFEDGAFRIAGTDRRMRLASVAARLGQHGTPARLAGTGRWQPSGPSFPNGCHAAEVEVDPETGAWRLVAYTMLHDFGRVLNPKLLEGQLQGGVAQGFGQAALERVEHDPESGQVLSGSWMDYAMPRADDLPPLTLTSRPTPAPSHPLGIKGAGEAGAAGAPPAVMNALAAALAPLGVGCLQMPATPQRVWRAIRAVAAVGT